MTDLPTAARALLAADEHETRRSGSWYELTEALRLALAQPAAAPSPQQIAEIIFEHTDVTRDDFEEPNAERTVKINTLHGVDEAASAILALFPAPAAEGWRDIASAPRNGTTFIAWLRGESSNAPHIVNSGWMGLARYKPNYPDGPPTIEYEGWRHPVTKAPTHWQSLPEPPR